MPKIRILSYDPSGNAKSKPLEGKNAVIVPVRRDESDKFILPQRDAVGDALGCITS